jgi:uncharacterized protein YjiS (DUF1127 family)
MFRAIRAWRRKRRHQRQSEQISVFDEQLLADLGLSWDDLRAAQAARADTSREGAVFP